VIKELCNNTWLPQSLFIYLRIIINKNNMIQYNFKALFYPKVTSKPNDLWNLYQISKAIGKPLSTTKRYLQYAGVTSSVLKPIDGRNNHSQQHFSEKSFIKFMKWMASGVRGPRK